MTVNKSTTSSSHGSHFRDGHMIQWQPQEPYPEPFLAMITTNKFYRFSHFSRAGKVVELGDIGSLSFFLFFFLLQKEILMKNLFSTKEIRAKR